MLYVVSRGHEHYNEGQESIVHLVSDVNSIRSVNQFCFYTDRHADLGYSEQIDNFSRIDELNWEAINQRYWSSVKEEKQAEFLAFQNVPWNTIKQIGVANQAMKQQVESLLTQSAHRPNVLVKADWYY